MMPTWVTELPTRVPTFLSTLRSEQTPGFYRYSLTGDFYDDSVRWGLGNAVFALKIYYTLGVEPEDKDALITFIQSFQDERGWVTDPLIRKKAFWREKLIALKNRSAENLFHKETERAETRQAISALALFDATPKHLPPVPTTPEAINTYLSKLNWNLPWGAGSHFSHLLFFLHHSHFPERDALIDHAVAWVNTLQHPDSGSWYTGNPSLSQQINGAMKVLTGLKVAERLNFNHATRLIDLALSATQDRQACDNFNVIYVLTYANQMTGGTYRKDEIEAFARKRLDIYHTYYFPEHGGFSFYKDQARRSYYGARITEGRNEPDIHGTVLFLWGIRLISELLEWDTELGFQEFTT